MSAPHTQIAGSDVLAGRVAVTLATAYPSRLDRIDAGKAMGVSGRVTCALAAGRPIGIDAWLMWCSALGLDPVTGARAGQGLPRYTRGAFLWWYFGAGVIGTRLVRRWTQARLAEKAGISKATLSRLESGTPISVAAVAAVCRVLELHPHGYCAPPPFDVSRRTTTETSCHSSLFSGEAAE